MTRWTTVAVLAVSAVGLGLLSPVCCYGLCIAGSLVAVFLPLRLAGLLGQRIGASLDAELARRRRHDELVQLLLEIAQERRVNQTASAAPCGHPSGARPETVTRASSIRSRRERLR